MRFKKKTKKDPKAEIEGIKTKDVRTQRTFWVKKNEIRKLF